MKLILKENRFVIVHESGTEVGEMTWSNAGSNLMIIDHTFVDEKFRGKGWAEQLVASGVTYAREQNKKIIPLCPFAKREFDKKTSYNDVLK